MGAMTIPRMPMTFCTMTLCMGTLCMGTLCMGEFMDGAGRSRQSTANAPAEFDPGETNHHAVALVERLYTRNPPAKPGRERDIIPRNILIERAVL
jgi:hypothetical protein